MSLLSYECVFIHFSAYHRRGWGGCQGKKNLLQKKEIFLNWYREVLGDGGGWQYFGGRYEIPHVPLMFSLQLLDRSGLSGEDIILLQWFNAFLPGGFGVKWFTLFLGHLSMTPGG